MQPDAGRQRAAPRPEARRTARCGSLAPARQSNMGTAGRAAIHAASLYRRTLHGVLRLIRSAEAEAHHLHAVEQKGEAVETPFIAILGLTLFFLPVFLVMTALAFAAYYLA